MAVRWCLSLLVVLALLSVPSAADGPAPAPMLLPGDDLPGLQALGWAGPWDLQDGHLRLHLAAPSGASWEADDVLRVQAPAAFEVHVGAWNGDLRPDRLEMHFFDAGGPCATADLLEPRVAGPCEGDVRVSLHLALPPGAAGTGEVPVWFQPVS